MAYNRSPGSLEEVKKAGAAIGDIKKISEKCSIIITMLPDSPQSEEVIISKKGIINFAEPGKIVVDMSSIDPIVSIKIGKMLAKKDIGFLDAPVSGGEPKAEDGSLAIMVGGDRKTFDEVIPLFKVLGDSYTLVGGIGAGNFTKLSNQIIVAINIAAVSEALILAKRAGLSPTSVYNAIRGGLAGSAVLENKALMMIEDDFNPGFKIVLHKKDMQNVLNAGSSLGVPLPLSAQLLEMFKSLVSSGNGELDHSGIVKFYEKISGIEIAEKAMG
jgi:2-hydroxy-3-oxopropionate reductase